jgi:predicted nucleic acid-binding protein
VIAPSGISARRVFVDTSAYFALFNDKDVDHLRAVAAMRQLAMDRAQVFTTNYVLAETHALVLRRLGWAAAVRVLDDLDASSTVVVRVSLGDEQRARTIIRQYTDKDFSLTDATSFSVMQRLRIGRAMTLDDHFAQYGFRVIEPAE